MRNIYIYFFDIRSNAFNLYYEYEYGYNHHYHYDYGQLHYHHHHPHRYFMLSSRVKKGSTKGKDGSELKDKRRKKKKKLEKAEGTGETRFLVLSFFLAFALSSFVFYFNGV